MSETPLPPPDTARAELSEIYTLVVSAQQSIYDDDETAAHRKLNELYVLMRESLASASREIADLGATNRRLNRRCQIAEAAVETKVEDFEKRSKRGLRTYYFNMGKMAAEQEIADLRAERDLLRREANRLIEAAFNADAKAACLEAELASVKAELARLKGRN